MSRPPIIAYYITVLADGEEVPSYSQRPIANTMNSITHNISSVNFQTINLTISAANILGNNSGTEIIISLGQSFI